MEIDKTCAIIPCAGRGSRLNLNKQLKALVKINKVPAINLLIKKIDKYISTFYIVISQKKFEEIKYLKSLDKKYHKKIIFIKSVTGKGDGQAVLDALNSMSKEFKNKYVLLSWCDTFFYNLKSLNYCKKYIHLNKINSQLIIPLVYKKNPYVGFLKDKNNIIKKVLFQRRNEFLNFGEQDLGFFFLKPKQIKKNLQKMQYLINNNKLKIKGNKKELNFLDLVNFLYKRKSPVYGITIPFKPMIYSFNTNKELNYIKNL